MLERCFGRLHRSQPWRWRGQVLESVGQTIESAGPLASVGECCEIVDRFGRAHRAEVIGFRGSNVLSMPVDSNEGIRFGDDVWASGTYPEIEVGVSLMGRVLNALGEPIDGLRSPSVSKMASLDGRVRTPLERVPIKQPLGTGIRALDALLTVGRGQRVGIFGGSGVGKSTLIGMMTRNTEADVTVVGLVGERGREVGEFLEDALGEEGRKRSVVVVSTSDESPLLRMRAALAAAPADGSFCSDTARYANSRATRKSIRARTQRVRIDSGSLSQSSPSSLCTRSSSDSHRAYRAMPTRSKASASRITRQPSPTSPRTSSAETSTSSRKTSLR